MTYIKKILSALFVVGALAGIGQATTYYVSSSEGTDTNSGLSSAQPWKTIAQVNRGRLKPGDSVLFKRGDLWRETLQPSTSGAMGNRITYGAYGSGSKPVISGSNVVPAAGIFRAENGLDYFGGVEVAPAALWDRGVRLTPAAHLEELRTPSQWLYDVEKKRVYFLAIGPREIEVQLRDLNIDNHEQSHILYDNLDLRHACEGLRLYSWKSRVGDIVLQNSSISTEPSVPRRIMSAGVYASVNTGTLSGITIQNNAFTPYSAGLEHWGVYFVQGVREFKISGNSFAAAGEDAITIWHSEHGVISDNTGGGNGENTVDVKDSHDIVISGNRGYGDGEYNIVVHGVDSDNLTYNITVEKNHCIRGGQAGHLTAGIVLLFTHDSKVRNNIVQEAYGAGVFINDKGIGFHNEISGNLLKSNGTQQRTGAITLEDVSDTEIRDNTVYAQGSEGFALMLEGGPHTRGLRVSGNTFFSDDGRMLDLATPAEAFVADGNVYYGKGHAIFRWKSDEYSFAAWQNASQQDRHSRLADPLLIRPAELSSGTRPK